MAEICPIPYSILTQLKLFPPLFDNQYEVCPMKETLLELKEHHGVIGIKTEFEAEGATFRDVLAQRLWTLQAGLPLYLKIGGVEALRDLKDARELGADGIIAPMVESPYGLKKFLLGVEKVYGSRRPVLGINIETLGGLKNLQSILDLAQGQIQFITIGRTDLTGSLMDGTQDPDSDRVLEMVKTIVQEVEGISLTLGGSLSARTLQILGIQEDWVEKIGALETRKVIFNRSFLLAHPLSLNQALAFEKDYLLERNHELDRERDFKNTRIASLHQRI